MAVVSISIDSIAVGGDGVGRSEGLVVFVPRTAPGDVVTAQIASKGQFARGKLADVVSPATVRIEPPCPHYTRDKCGGCQLQHMTYDSQLAAKQLIIFKSTPQRDARLHGRRTPSRSTRLKCENESALG